MQFDMKTLDGANQNGTEAAIEQMWGCTKPRGGIEMGVDWCFPDLTSAHVHLQREYFCQFPRRNSKRFLSSKLKVTMSDSCPSGFAWDKVVEECLSCSLCKDFPATAICQQCSGTPGGDPDNGALPTGTIVGIVVSCVALVVFVAALFLVYRKYWKNRDVTTRPVQVDTDPEADSETQRL
ncbi:Hypp4681 [Branchiostoma lanceolatum]|uniref:Hypp4681 protein n=1 Tax=Branchiostoma lanceolatum TaxID=7740 RepID=A0A8K0A905_BRALA|nr:Hypp4681 [Branchiostoma lanceolatum]